MIEETKRVRPYMSEDFYPLTGYTLSDLDWMAWQLHRPEDGSGVVMAFRRENSSTPGMMFALNAIDADAEYEIEDADAGAPETASGAELLSGYPVRIPEKRMCRILFYRKK